MRRSISAIPLVFFVLVLLLPACVSKPRAVRPDQLTFAPLVFHVPEVEQIELPNGIRLYLKEDHELPLVQVTAMAGAGSIGEPADKTGLGSLFASTLRTGGAGDYSPDSLDSALERVAADLSVATDTYATTIDLSAQSGDLEKGMAIIADLLRRPGFAPEKLELARKQLIEGIRRQNDNPASIASRALAKAVYGDHPLGRTPTVESVSAVSRDNLVEFHHRYFHPNNLWFAVSGDFDREGLLQLFERLLGDWPRVDFTPQPVPPVSGPSGPKVLVGKKEVSQTTVLLGELGIDKSDPDLQAVRVMNYILGGGGFNSRLMREVRSNRGLAYSVYSYYQVGRRLPGPFIAGFETKSASTLEVVGLVRRMMREMRERPVSEEELELARESLINSFVFAFTDTHAVVTQIMRLDYYDYPEGYLETYRDRVAEVTREDVLSAAREHLHPDRQAVILVGAENNFDAPVASLGLPVEAIPLEE
jgi:zinc protease